MTEDNRLRQGTSLMFIRASTLLAGLWLSACADPKPIEDPSASMLPFDQAAVPEAGSDGDGMAVLPGDAMGTQSPGPTEQASPTGDGDAPGEPPPSEMSPGQPTAMADGGVPEAPDVDAAVPPPAREDLGEGDGRDVVTIGDSWMNYIVSGGGIEGALRRAGKSYRGYGVAGTTLAGSIPGQYTSAKRADPNIATVIMTGGGNDIMFSGACNTSAGCEAAVQEIADRLDTLWTEMADDGVKDVIYIAYSDGAGTTPQGTRPTGMRPVPPICLSGRIRCHTLPTTDLVMDELIDGIHPAPAANDRIAAGLLELMEMDGIRR